jgi:hypothetical protein
MTQVSALGHKRTLGCARALNMTGLFNAAVSAPQMPFERVSATVGLCFRETRFARQQRQSAHTKTRQFGPNLHDTGKSLLRGTAWWGWEDSNFQPNDYESLAPSSLWRFPG